MWHEINDIAPPSQEARNQTLWPLFPKQTRTCRSRSVTRDMSSAWENCCAVTFPRLRRAKSLRLSDKSSFCSQARGGCHWSTAGLRTKQNKQAAGKKCQLFSPGGKPETESHQWLHQPRSGPLAKTLRHNTSEQAYTDTGTEADTQRHTEAGLSGNNVVKCRVQRGQSSTAIDV